MTSIPREVLALNRLCPSVMINHPKIGKTAMGGKRCPSSMAAAYASTISGAWLTWSRSTTRLTATRRVGAPAMLYVDNTRQVDPWAAITLPAEIVERIILFRPVDAGALFTLGSGNGVIMVITKQGSRRD